MVLIRSYCSSQFVKLNLDNAFYGGIMIFCLFIVDLALLFPMLNDVEVKILQKDKKRDA
jgi:NADH:ubiquinone oxidoreductase subunit 3 (subunit A)